MITVRYMMRKRIERIASERSPGLVNVECVKRLAVTMHKLSITAAMQDRY